MKILFLDIDGVCNSGTYAHKLGVGGILGIDPIAAKKVQKIIEDTGCEVVLSSSWRLWPDTRKAVEDQVCALKDITVDFRGRTDRGCEVKDWLEKHPEVTRYAILDDNGDFHKDQHLFKTTWSKGLTNSIAKKVTEHLNATN